MKPDGYDQFVQEKISVAHEKLIKQFYAREEAFLENCAKQYFPPVIVRWVHERKNLAEIARWVAALGFHTRRHTNGKIEFAKGDTILATLDPVKFQ